MNTKEREKKKMGQEISFSQYLDTLLYMHDCIFLMLFSIFATRPSICSRFVTFKVAASLPRRASDQCSLPGQLPGINAGGLRGGTPRECSPFHMTGQPLRRAVVKMELHDGQEASEAVARTPHDSEKIALIKTSKS